LRASVVVFVAALVAVAIGAARARADTTPTPTTTATVASTPAPDPAPTPAPDPAPVVHAKPKPHVATHVVRTTPRPVTPAPTPVVVTPVAPAPAQTPVVRAPTHVAATPKKTHVHRRAHPVKPKAKPKHVAVSAPKPAHTTPAAPVLPTVHEPASGRVTAAARVQSFSSQWQRLLSWLLLVGSLIVLACAALPALVPRAPLVVEGRMQLALLGAALAAGGVSLLIMSGA
jgi:hypothetical protein